SEDGKVRAANLNGSAAWPLEGSLFQAGGAIVADLKIDDLALYVASMDSKLYALDRSSPKIRWQYFAGAPLRESPVGTANSVYHVVPNVGVVALDKTEGKYNREPKWIARGAKRFVSESDKYAFVVSGDNHLVAYEKATGEPKFKSKRTDLVAFAI